MNLFKTPVKLCNDCRYSEVRDEDFESKLFCMNSEANKNNISYLTKIKSENFIHSCREARYEDDSCSIKGKYYEKKV